MADSAQVARLKRTRERIQEVLQMIHRQDDALQTSLQEVSAAIEDEERRG